MGFKSHANSESPLKEDCQELKFSPLKWTSAISLGIDSQAGRKRSAESQIDLFYLGKRSHFIKHQEDNDFIPKLRKLS
ncbi:hypothetical protein [Argonema antarcticum]|uniref:hypothetical protein n=1 Tax=Argonema antarcticum TaxID=2942763 RepID=UPI002012BE93|nr:hypothetical protein [Argonema antarcticum]MCL1474315.1 hypothetical protein [Argonema antarcticum A004/B2]